MTAWDYIVWALTCVFGGIFPARTALYFLAPAKGRVRWIVPYLVIGAALGMPTWAGDGNPLYYFPFLLVPARRLPHRLRRQAGCAAGRGHDLF